MSKKSISILLVLAYVLFFFIQENFENPYVKNEYFYSLSFKGKIEDKKQLSTEHNIARFSVVNDSSKLMIALPNNPNEFFETIQEGDFIYKRKNSIYCYLIRNRDTIKLQFSFPEGTPLDTIASFNN
ncbi:hypothetical protein [Persicobacter psychrovividus]|uniref:Uncharacterized protein n=1 Tax=Persicobacter psychrovividus TaxID=387638 RepID=A0ABN6LGP1_9BACT|nr:hypothetical protein PEPS_45850 [Persicobacter psychrovividus]